jgi:hypothetical protein
MERVHITWVQKANSNLEIKDSREISHIYMQSHILKAAKRQQLAGMQTVMFTYVA